MTTTPETIQGLVRDALAGATDAADRVYVPRTWATRTAQMPLVLVRLVASDKRSLGKGDVQFTVTDQVQIVIQTAAVAAGDDEAVLAAETQGWRVQRQVEVALFNSADLMAALQNIPSIQVQVARSSDGQQTVVEMQSRIGFEYYMGPEDFGGYEGEEVVVSPLNDLEDVRIATQLVGPDTTAPGPVADVVTLD